MLTSLRRVVWAACLVGLCGSAGNSALPGESPATVKAVDPGSINAVPGDWQELLARGWR